MRGCRSGVFVCRWEREGIYITDYDLTTIQDKFNLYTITNGLPTAHLVCGGLRSIIGGSYIHVLLR